MWHNITQCLTIILSQILMVFFSHKGLCFSVMKVEVHQVEIPKGAISPGITYDIEW